MSKIALNAPVRARATKKFHDDFAAFAAARVESGAYTEDDVEELRRIVRADLCDGPDMQRAGMGGVVGMSPAVDDADERRSLWAAFFSEAADRISGRNRLSITRG